MLSHLQSDPRRPVHSVPRDAPSEEVETFRGHDWCRNFPRVCPHCQKQFFAWAPWPWPADWKPNAIEPLSSLRLGGGHRETCGRPDCILDAQWEFDLWSSDQRARIAQRRAEKASFDRAAASNDSTMRDAAGGY